MSNGKQEQQLQRITYYESLLQKAEDVLSSGDRSAANLTALEKFLRELEAYYVSAEWKQDFADDEAGLLPADLKRGVLSEDGIDHVLDEGREWRITCQP